MNRQRLEYIDIAKGIAVICIVLGHLNVRNINVIVYTFHVPIFFFITGYFIKDETPVKPYILKKYKTLLIPYACTCLVIIVLSMIVNEVFLGGFETLKLGLEWLYASIYGSGGSYNEPFYIKRIGAIWFLWATFWGTSFLKIILRLKQPLQRITVVLLLFAIGYWSRVICWFPFSIQAGMCSVLFMYLGYQIKYLKDPFHSLCIEPKITLTLLALGVWIGFIRGFKSFYLVNCDVGRGATDIFGCICGSYIVVLISWFISKHCRWLSKALCFMGENSIFVLCAHIIELDVFQWDRIINILVMHGLPERLGLYVKILGKFIWIIPVTYLCSKSAFICSLFGITRQDNLYRG